MSASSAKIAPDWIAVDWGTSNMRAWAMSVTQGVLARATSSAGMGGLAPEQFEAALSDVIGEWLAETPVPVIACGMVGARQGWIEAAYATAPCPPPGIAEAARPAVRDQRFEVHILPGVMQQNPADVMRGEETQIAGFLAANPAFNGTICLPGTHTKWVEVAAGRIARFRTFMTGEIFALLSKNSILRHSVEGENWDQTAFEKAIRLGAEAPEALAANLFQIRAEGLVGEMAPDVAKSHLSGLLIGQEISAAKPFWNAGQVAIVGEDALARAYQSGLAVLGGAASLENPEPLTLAGLSAAFAAYRKDKR